MPWTRDNKKSLRIAGVFAGVVAAALTIYFLREPIAASTRSWRSAHSLSKAKKALGNEEAFGTAFELALVARQLNPESIEAPRVLVDAAFKSRSVRTLEYANALFLSPKANEEDRLLVLQIMHEARDHIGFVRLYN